MGGREDVDLKSVAVVGLLVVVLGALMAWALLGGISRGESAKALYEAGGTVVSKTLGGPLSRSGFFVEAEPNGRGVRRIRVEVSEAEWSDLEVGGAFPAGSESARDAAGLVDEGDGDEEAKGDRRYHDVWAVILVEVFCCGLVLKILCPLPVALPSSVDTDTQESQSGGTHAQGSV